MQKIKIFTKRNILQKFSFNFGIGLALKSKYNKVLGFNKRVISPIYLKSQILSFLSLRKDDKITQTLVKKMKNNFKLQKQIKLYKAVRTKLGLPSHGQRTKTNSKTKKKLRRSKGGSSFDFSNFFKYDKK